MVRTVLRPESLRRWVMATCIALALTIPASLALAWPSAELPPLPIEMQFEHARALAESLVAKIAVVGQPYLNRNSFRLPQSASELPRLSSEEIDFIATRSKGAIVLGVTLIKEGPPPRGISGCFTNFKQQVWYRVDRVFTGGVAPGSTVVVAHSVGMLGRACMDQHLGRMRRDLMVEGTPYVLVLVPFENYPAQGSHWFAHFWDVGYIVQGDTGHMSPHTLSEWGIWDAVTQSAVDNLVSRLRTRVAQPDQKRIGKLKTSRRRK